MARKATAAPPPVKKMSVRESSWSPEQLELPHTEGPGHPQVAEDPEVQSCLRRRVPMRWFHKNQRQDQRTLAVLCLMNDPDCEACHKMLDYIRR